MGQRKTVIGSQLWWNWEVDAERYRGWQELIKDLTSEHIKVMTYCNPCLAPVYIYNNLEQIPIFNQDIMLLMVQT